MHGGFKNQQWSSEKSGELQSFKTKYWRIIGGLLALLFVI